MAFVKDRIEFFDSQLDHLQLFHLQRVQKASLNVENFQNSVIYDASSQVDSARSRQLRTSIKYLSMPMQRSASLVQASKIAEVLENARLGSRETGERFGVTDLESELEWYLLWKAAIRTYGILLDDLIEKVSLMNSSSWYWSRILSSNRSLGLYSVQTSPPRIWALVRQILYDVYQGSNIVHQARQQFRYVCRSMGHETLLRLLQKSAIRPITWARAEILQKQDHLKRTKSSLANCLGCLLRFGFQSTSSQDVERAKLSQTGQFNNKYPNLEIAILRGIDVLEATTAVLASSSDKPNTTTAGFHQHRGQDSEIEERLLELQRLETMDITDKHLKDAAQQLINILENHIPNSLYAHSATLSVSGPPSRLVRYWLPCTALAASSIVSFGVYLRSRAAIAQWVQNFGVTVFDFWTNWVIEPSMKIVGTIRHDEASAISILSRKSLEGDRASLERMVLDFASDTSQEFPLNQVQLEDIRVKIQEGDLTPVLRVYEKEMQRPVYGSLRGSLIRALLIQIQKTKVDIEVAMGGIDSLLKSQELVFGFIGLTPGFLVCFSVIRWLGSLSINRRSFSQRRKASQTLHLLRNIDRILSWPAADADSLSLEQYGLLVCEATGIRKIAEETLPTDVFREFIMDFDELVESSQSLFRQRRIADRMRWAYWRWL